MQNSLRHRKSINFEFIRFAYGFVDKGTQIIKVVDSWGIIQHGEWWLLVRID